MTPVPMAAKVSSWVMTVMPNALLALLALFDGVGGGGKLAPAPRWPRASAEHGEIRHRAAFQRTPAARRHPQLAAALGGRQHPGTETLDDFARTLDQRTVARMHAAIEPQIVLQANAHMPA